MLQTSVDAIVYLYIIRCDVDGKYPIEENAEKMAVFLRLGNARYRQKSKRIRSATDKPGSIEKAHRIDGLVVIAYVGTVRDGLISRRLLCSRLLGRLLGFLGLLIGFLFRDFR